MQIVIRTEFKPSHLVHQICICSKHYNRSCLELFVILYDRGQIKAVHYRHHYISYNQVRSAVSDSADSFFSVLRKYYIIIFLKQNLHKIAHIPVVINNQYCLLIAVRRSLFSGVKVICIRAGNFQCLNFTYPYHPVISHTFIKIAFFTEINICIILKVIKAFR